MSGYQIETVKVDTEQQLTQWALWSRSHGVKLTHARFDLSQYTQTRKAATPDISDADAMRIDAVIAQMKKTAPVWHEVILLRFIQQLTYRQIGRYHLKCSEEMARRATSDAISFVGGGLLSVVQLDAQRKPAIF